MYLAGSLGFGVTISKCRKKCVNNGKWGTYYRVLIAGDKGIELFKMMSYIGRDVVLNRLNFNLEHIMEVLKTEVA